MSIFVKITRIKILGTKRIFRNNILRWKHSKSQNKSSKPSEWKGVVGLEVHAQITSKSKLFSGADTEFGGPVNNSVALFDAAIPGTLPVLNRKCVEAAVLTALALECRINSVSTFDRKHYFYADLPAGYQITQQRAALANDGRLEFQVLGPTSSSPYLKVSRLRQLQLEQDSGKSLHDEVEARSLVDLNRAGIPLMELVFDPDLSDGEEAASLVKELTLVLQTLGTCSCRMEEGALRVDANISIQRSGSSELGPRTEVKNIGSIRGVANAVSSEIARQIAVVRAGGTVVSETRAYDAATKLTVPMRDKEEKMDYRFMPEPNLPPLRVWTTEGPAPSPDQVSVEELRQGLPELPEQTRINLRTQFGVSPEVAITLVNEKPLLQLFTEIMTSGRARDARITSNILLHELLACLNKNKLSISQSSVSSAQLGDLVDLLQADTINYNTAKRLLQDMVNGETALPSELVKQQNLHKISDPEIIKQLCLKIIEENPKLVEQYRGGKTKLFGALLGSFAKSVDQKADMAAATKCLKQLLENPPR